MSNSFMSTWLHDMAEFGTKLESRHSLYGALFNENESMSIVQLLNIDFKFSESRLLE